MVDFNLLRPSNLNMVGSYQQGVDTSNHNAQNGLQMQQELEQMRQRNLMGQQQQIATKILQDNGGDVVKAAPQLSQISPEWALKMQPILQQNATLNKPVWDSASGQFVTPPSSQNTTGQAVQPQGYTPSQKQSLELQGLKLGNQSKQAALTATKDPKFDSQSGGWIYPPDANNPNGRFVPMQQGENAQGSGGNLTGDQFLNSLDQSRAAQIKALAEGRMAMPAGFALKSPYWQGMLRDLAQYNPAYDATLYQRRQQTSAAFSKGQQGNAVRAVNQALYHMGTLSDAIDKLDNFNGMLTPLNLLVNPAEKATGDVRQGNFEQAANAVSNELRKVFTTSGGGSLQELEHWRQSMPVNGSHEQQTAYLKQGAQLLNGALNALNAQYQKGMGPDATIMDLISPAAKHTLQQISGESYGVDTSNPPTPSNNGWGIQKVN